MFRIVIDWELGKFKFLPVLSVILISLGGLANCLVLNICFFINLPANVGSPERQSIGDHYIEESDVEKQPVVHNWRRHVALLTMEEDHLHWDHPCHDSKVEKAHAAAEHHDARIASEASEQQQEYVDVDAKADVHSILELHLVTGAWF